MQLSITTPDGQEILLPPEFALDDDDVTKDIPSVVIPGKHGQRPYSGLERLGPRILRASGVLQAESPEAADHLASTYKGLFLGRGELKLRRNVGDERYIHVRCTNVRVDPLRGRFGGTVRAMTFTFRADDPFWYGPDQEIVQTVAGPPGGYRVEAEDPNQLGSRAVKVEYVGEWVLSTFGGTGRSGRGSMTTEHSGDYVDIKFYGAGLAIRAWTTATPRVADIYLDGQLIEEDFTYVRPGSENTFASIYSIEVEPGEHTLRYLAKDAIESKVHYIDAFDIIPSSVLTVPNPGTVPVSPTIFLRGRSRRYHGDFVGKLTGNVAQNPHRAKGSTGTTDGLPDAGTEFTNYGGVVARDGRTAATAVTSNGIYARHKFSFDLSEVTGNDIERLKAHLKSITFRGVFDARGVNGAARDHRASIKAWNHATQSWIELGQTGAQFTRSSSAYTEEGQQVGANVPRFRPGNYGVKFDGVDDVVETSQNMPITDNAPRTLEAWFKWLGGPGMYGIASFGDINRVGAEFSLYIWNGKFKLQTGSNDLNSTEDVPINEWVHFRATWDGENASIYVNGELKDTGKLNALVTPSTPFRIGRPASPSEQRRFRGYIDEVRLWNVVHTDDDWNKKIVEAPGLVARWGADEGDQGDGLLKDTAPPINLLTENQANCGEDGTLEGLFSRGPGVSIARDTMESWQGSSSVKVTIGSSSQQDWGVTNRSPGNGYLGVPVFPGQRYRASAYVKSSPGNDLVIWLGRYTEDNVLIASSAVFDVADGDWQRISHAIDIETGVTRLAVVVGSRTSHAVVYVDGIQVQRGNTLTPWTPGDKQPFHGTIHGAQYTPDNPFGSSFGSAVLVEEGTTNILSQNQSLGLGWSLSHQGSTVTLTQGQTDPFGGDRAVRVQGSGGDNAIKTLIVAGIPGIGNRWSGQMWIRPRHRLRVSSNITGGDFYLFEGGWTHLKWTLDNPPSDVAAAQIQLRSIDENGDDDADGFVDCDVAFLQYEDKLYNTSWVLGGTTREAETFTIPTAGVISLNEFQIDIEVEVTEHAAAAAFFDARTAVDKGIHIGVSGSKQLTLRINDKAVLSPHVEPLGHHRYTLRYSGSEATLARDGITVLSVNDWSGEVSVPERATIGRVSYSPTGYANTHFSWLRIRSATMSDAEVAAEFDAGLLKPDQYTTAFLPMSGDLSGITSFEATITEGVSEYVNDSNSSRPSLEIMARSLYPSDGNLDTAIMTDYAAFEVEHDLTVKPKVTNRGKNLLVNGGFERGLEGWNSLSGFVELYSMDAYQGNACVKLTSDDTGSRLINQIVPVIPGTAMLLSAWVKGLRPHNGFRLQIGWRDANGQSLDFLGVAFPLRDYWNQVQLTAIAPPNATYAWVHVLGGDERGVFLIDGVQLELVADVNATATDFVDQDPTILEAEVTLTESDILRVDGDRRLVTKNGASVIGAANERFLLDGFKLAPGENQLEFEDAGGELYDVIMRYKPKWY